MKRTQWTTGPHLLELEPPDLFHCYVRGTVLASEVNETLRIMREEVIPNVGDVYFIVHMKELREMPRETRQYLLGHVPPSRGTVVVGGTAILRMALNILAQGMIALSRKRILMRVVSTDEDAWACINEWRSASTGAR